MDLLRRYVRNVLQEIFQSHTEEPAPGDHIVNINPGCAHKGSQGVVLSVQELPDEQGKTVEYQCTNDGPTWDIGDVLVKTMDQLAPLLEEGEY
mgnify:CR=1 FL=1|tara:strand:+ start:672 stop:950 length:279 start_codon:yes stop_codon:yes gene_type:complete